MELNDISGAIVNSAQYKLKLLFTLGKTAVQIRS